jgi:hypothetical protein
VAGRYLEKSGVIDALTKVLVGLYEEPERPPNAVDYIKRYMGAPTGVDVEVSKQPCALRKRNVLLFLQAKPFYIYWGVVPFSCTDHTGYPTPK